MAPMGMGASSFELDLEMPKDIVMDNQIPVRGLASHMVDGFAAPSGSMTPLRLKSAYVGTNPRGQSHCHRWLKAVGRIQRALPRTYPVSAPVLSARVRDQSLPEAVCSAALVHPDA